MYHGEAWAYGVIEAVMHSPAWPQTLLIYTYDEHGGYYDHVPPPAAIAPDAIPPALAPGDAPGGYDLYGPRVLATIKAKFNLPALTYRDANAATVMDFLDTRRAAFLTPPAIAAPSPTGPSGPVTVS